MLTTQQCAEKLNTLYDAPGTFDRRYIRAEVDNGRLHARINISVGRSGRKRVRIHVDDFAAYLQAVHQSVAVRV